MPLFSEMPEPSRRHSAPLSFIGRSFLPVTHTRRPSHGPPLEPPRRKAPRRSLGALALVAMAALVCTRERTSPSPEIVSGRASPRKTQSGAEERWWPGATTVTFDASLDDIDPTARDAIGKAFGTWLISDAKLPALTFDSGSRASVVPTTADGENRVYYAPITIPNQENALAITLAYSDSETGEIIEADVIVNARYPFGVLSSPAGDDGDDDNAGSNADVGSTTQALAGSAKSSSWCRGRYDLQSVMSHEVGHFFGLGEDMTDPDATMFFSTNRCELKKRDLSAPDIQEMSALYLADPPGFTSPEQASHCSISSLRSGGANGGSIGIGFLGFAAVYRARRRLRHRDARV